MSFNATRIMEFQRGRIEGWAAVKALQDVYHNLQAGTPEWTVARDQFEIERQAWEETSGSRWCYEMFVNLVEIDQGYGGPEEGGWWYDITTPVCCIPVIDAGSAIKAIELLSTIAEHRYGGRDRWRDGTDASIYFDDSAAKHEPEERPHYE